VGREEEFSAFTLAYSRHLLSTAFWLVGDRGHAEDLVQSTLLKVYVNWKRVESADSSIAYARRIMLTTSMRQRHRRRVREELAVFPDFGTDPPQDAVDDRDQLRRLLLRLSPRQRAVVVLRFYADLSIEETARTLNCAEGTVKSQTAKALANLRDALPITVLGRQSHE
jgi:RNA polymerase sigma-70 factor (sigma-E family)